MRAYETMAACTSSMRFQINVLAKRFLLCSIQKQQLLRNYSLSASLCRCPIPESTNGDLEEIIVPKKKSWDKLAVLQALAGTCNRDPTSAHYMFQDDPYLTPKTSLEFKLFSLSQESGRNAAKYIINTNPRFFQRDYAEPHIPCLMPITSEPQINDISEAALAERIQLRKVKDAVDIFDQLLQAGKPVSLESTNNLLDLICFYGDREPAQENEPAPKDSEVEEDPQEHQKKRKPWTRRGSELLGFTWRDDNNAERIFNLMPERNERSFCALIRGMVKYGAYTKAFSTYTDLMNNRLTADVHTFNALITAAPEAREKYAEKWDLIEELLKQMSYSNVQPNLLTFNAVLRSLRKCGHLSKVYSLQTVKEMKALNISPSLATFDYLLSIHYKSISSPRNSADLLSAVLDEIEGKQLTVQDSDDVNFFVSAMKICLSLKEVEIAYRLHKILGEGDNWKLLGDNFNQNVFYGHFFSLLCMMENIDVVLQWYKDLIPSLFYPNYQGMRELLQALDADNRLEVIPHIWEDIKQFGLATKADLVEEVLMLMARDKHSFEVQNSFADCAVSVMSAYEGTDSDRSALNWTSGSLANVATLLLRADRIQESWSVLQLFKENRVPSVELLSEFLDCTKVKEDGDLAINVLDMAGRFSLPATPGLIKRVKEEFPLTEEQRNHLNELERATSDSSDTSDNSDTSDSDRE
ncbi:pentatricopeptide repeat domain-containing protein 3, mitochondrial [Polypterus senegalus]|uniref:pentatricopeptide repeat domain-containing protein 3, mitochondrial n=1 Tax=Polypterus senegalus TaxID=55291 RepID=UPI001963D4F6|nr:pentatricopeptide repeat domain-containing protein 3, mitochondrial [Polypterus senegalus]